MSDHRGQRTPPPDHTGGEAGFLGEVSETGGAVVVHLRDGTQIRGTLSGFDHDMLQVLEAGGREFVLRKSDVRYVEDVDGH